MTDENPVTPSPGNNPWEQAFNEGELPRINEISIGTIIAKRDRLTRQAQTTGPSWSNQELREEIRRDIEFAEPVLRAPVEIAKGETPVLAITPHQESAIEIFFDVNFRFQRPLYALIESVAQKPTKIEVLIKSVAIKPKTTDHLVVSQSAAHQLGFNPQQERKDIRVLEIYQKIADIDLDRL